MATGWDIINESLNAGPKIPFMKLQSGKNICRIVAAPEKVVMHWEKTVDGALKKVICLDDHCPLCQLGHQPTVRYQLKVIDKTDSENQEAKVLEVGKMVIKQIYNFVQDEEYGDPTKYDLKIQKDGIGRDTRYTVTASPRKSDLTDAEKEKANELPDFEEINAKMTAEEIKSKLGLACFAGNELDDDFGEAAPKSSNKTQALDDWESL